MPIPVPAPSAKWLIIGMLALVLSGCSAVRLAYDNGPALALWRLDRWLDLDEVQEGQARPALARWFAWHRATKLPAYARTLASWRQRAQGPVTAAELCAEADRLRETLATAIEQILPDAAELLPLVRPAQFAHLARVQAERRADWRSERLQPRAEDRLAAQVERAIERAEDFYGPLQDSQKALLTAAQEASPFDPELWLRHREQRDAAVLQGLQDAQRIEAPAARLAALRAVAERLQRAPEGPYAQMQVRWQAHSCDTAASLHNTATPAQRKHLAERLAGWEEDVRVLAAQSAS